MPVAPPKKMVGLELLDLLRTYTDADHRLSQRQIGDLLQSEYATTVDRKTVRRNLLDLVEAGYDIEYATRPRALPGGGTENVLTDWYIQHDFEPSELRLLVDSVLLSHQIPTRQRKQLVKKLCGLQSRYFEANVSHVNALPEVRTANRQLFYAIDVLDEAIGANRQVELHYGTFGTDGKLHPRLDAAGKPRLYRVDPYEMVATNGRYYLICRYSPNSEQELTYLRVDRILDITVGDKPVARPLRSLPGYENGLDLPRHMAEQLYMFPGRPVHVRLRVAHWMLDQVFDWFGDNVRCEHDSVEDDHVDVVLRANEQSMLYWCMQYADAVEVLEPESLRAKLLEVCRRQVEKYA
jgi:predicted DNA-binding transcriptional regulator YafY